MGDATVDWRRVQTLDQLLAARARQLERREEDLETAGRKKSEVEPGIEQGIL